MTTTNAVPYINELLIWNEQLLGLPALPLIFIGCLAVGYACKAIPVIPNRWIPFVVIQFGIVANVLMNARPTGEITAWIALAWLVRQIIFGLVTGVAAKVELAGVFQQVQVIHATAPE